MADKLKCQGCGVEKDIHVYEISPHHEADALHDGPISPILGIECQDNDDRKDFRQVFVCHECFHKLEPDMWISKRCWESINPVIPFADLQKIEG